MQITPRIAPCLSFESQAEEAANFYVSVFPRSWITQISHYGEVGREIHGGKPGSVLTVAFELDAQLLTALNGGPVFRFTEAVSLQVMCEDQREVDHYWSRLGQGGDDTAQQCGWLMDRFGLSWQVLPRTLIDMITDADRSVRLGPCCR